MRDPAYPTVCTFGALLCLLPLPWHWQARNMCTLIYLGWVFTACLVSMINSFIWAGNVRDSAPVWCDISSRYVVSFNVGVVASSLCIQRRLYRIACIKEASVLRDSRRKELLVELTIGLGLPLLMIPLHYIVQAKRYMILEDVGCWPSVYITPLNCIASRMWSVLIGGITLVYSALTLREFMKTRRQFSRILSESGTDMSLSRFFRLMALSLTMALCSLSLSLYFLISLLVKVPHTAWASLPSWAVTHQDIGVIETVDHYHIHQDRNLRIRLEINRWCGPCCAFTFFLYFGLSNEATKQYKLIFWKIVSTFGFNPPSPKPESHNLSWPIRLIHRSTMANSNSNTTSAVARATIGQAANRESQINVGTSSMHEAAQNFGAGSSQV